MSYYCCSWFIIPINPVFLITGVGMWMALISEWLLRCSYKHFITSCHWQAVLLFSSLPSLSLVFLFLVLLSHIFTCFAFISFLLQILSFKLRFVQVLVWFCSFTGGKDRLTPILLHLRDHRLLAAWVLESLKAVQHQGTKLLPNDYKGCAVLQNSFVNVGKYPCTLESWSSYYYELVIFLLVLKFFRIVILFEITFWLT